MLTETGAKKFVTDLDFADDIVLCSPTVEGAQRMLTAVELGALTVGLELNVKKTKYIITDPSGNIPKATTTMLTKNGPIEEVDKYRYLGVWTDTDFDIEQRLGQAWAQMRKFCRVWKSPALPDDTKIRLWRTFVEPIAIYGTPAYAWTMKRADRMRGAMTKMLRMALDVPFDAHIRTQALYRIGLPNELSFPQVSGLRRLGKALRSVAVSSTKPNAQAQPLLHLVLANPPANRRRGGNTVTITSTIEKQLGLAAGPTRLPTLLDKAAMHAVITAACAAAAAKTQQRIATTTVAHQRATRFNAFVSEAREFLYSDDAPLTEDARTRLKRTRLIAQKEAEMSAIDPSVAAAWDEEKLQRPTCRDCTLHFYTAAFNTYGKIAIARPGARRYATTTVAAHDFHTQAQQLEILRAVAELSPQNTVCIEAALPLITGMARHNATPQHDYTNTIARHCVIFSDDPTETDPPATEHEANLRTLRAIMRERDRNNVGIHILDPSRPRDHIQNTRPLIEDILLHNRAPPHYTRFADPDPPPPPADTHDTAPAATARPRHGPR